DGDIVTVYGTFTGLALGIPQIRANHVVFNNMLPDPVEFLPAVIEVLNMHGNALQWEYEGGWNEYLGNGRMNLVVAHRGPIDLLNVTTHVLGPEPGSGPDGRLGELWVDGFLIAFTHVDENNNGLRMRPFGMAANTVYLDTVRLVEMALRPWGSSYAVSIRVISELR
ncbi:MAG: hypothetical protein FWD96_01995, partial [Defluviitaleaceae bacterium]|nr:hypothetical protein [Defluviitaleaceae bacterium]